MLEAIAIGIGLMIAGFAVGAWGVVQVLDIMEALDLRRAEKARELQKAREYLRNPSEQGSVGYNVDTTAYTTTANTTTANVPPSNAPLRQQTSFTGKGRV